MAGILMADAMEEGELDATARNTQELEYMQYTRGEELQTLRRT